MDSVNLLNKKVKHLSFGIGTIIDQGDSYIEVSFSDDNKKFIYPDAFDKFLKLEDEALQGIIDEQINAERKAERARLLETEAKLQAERRIRQAQSGSAGDETQNSRQVVFWCEPDEKAEIFTNWTVHTGTIKSGARKGQPNKLVRLNKHSACLLTERHADQEEKERAIIGLFMVDEDFSGRTCDDGYIPAHEKYRIKLSDEEVKQMQFWKYYRNPRSPENITWNTGRSRYFENLVMAQILRDLVALRAGTDQHELTEEFFKYFCHLNLINEDDIPENNGALLA